MYILQNNSNVIYGPAEYNFGMLKHSLLNDLEMAPESFSIPLKDPSAPLVIDTNTSILPVQIVTPSYNSKIAQLAGPTWAFTSTEATGTYTVADKNIDAVKNELKTLVAADRYKEETKDLTLTVAGVPVIVEGSRENKTILLLTAPLLPATGVTTFKFPKSDNFVDCTKADIDGIIAAMIAQTQGAFNWESAKAAEITACLDLVSLDAVVLTMSPATTPLV